MRSKDIQCERYAMCRYTQLFYLNALLEIEFNWFFSKCPMMKLKENLARGK